MKRTWVRLGVTAIAGGAGYVLNAVPLDAVARVWPGRLITVPVALVWGPWYGAVAAAIAAPATYQFTPFQLAVFVAEALIVGWAARRHKSPLLIGSLFWAAFAATHVIPNLYPMDRGTRRIPHAGCRSGPMRRAGSFSWPCCRC